MDEGTITELKYGKEAICDLTQEIVYENNKVVQPKL